MEERHKKYPNTIQKQGREKRKNQIITKKSYINPNIWQNGTGGIENSITSL